jgi:hypothetical protein
LTLTFSFSSQTGFPFKSDIYPDPPSPSSSSFSPTHLKPIAISMVPSVAELASALAAAKSSSPLAAREVEVGSAKDLGRTIGELLRENRRLIIVDRVHEMQRAEEDRWERADSYSTSFPHLLTFFPLADSPLFGQLTKLTTPMTNKKCSPPSLRRTPKPLRELLEATLVPVRRSTSFKRLQQRISSVLSLLSLLLRN